VYDDAGYYHGKGKTCRKDLYVYASGITLEKNPSFKFDNPDKGLHCRYLESD